MALKRFGRTSLLALARALSFPAAALVCAGLGAASRAIPAVVIPLIAAILAAVAFAAFKRFGLERQAAALSGDDLGSGLAKTLPALARRLQALASREAHAHPVTGLPTRERLNEAVATDIAAGVSTALLGVIRFVDYDRLAGFDHSAANMALQHFADRLTSAVRAGRVIGQIDRDCFAVWFGAGGVEAASPELQAIAYVVGQEIELDETVLSPIIEVGFAEYPRDGADGPELILRATSNLARPDAGHRQTRPAAPVSAKSARDRFLLEQDLAQAIAENQLTMVFQPVVDLHAGRMLGAEALLRWDHPRLGPVSPAKFIPIVEDMGLSERYGLWVLNAACREARTWRDCGLNDLKVAVNLSAHQLLDPEILTKVERTLARHGLGAAALELELTETAAMADAERTSALFSQLRAMGVSMAIDDFGSGYSSLSYLKNLPFDKLKIDREFVTDVDQHVNSRAICSALLELGRGLNLLVLAEGVETEAEVSTLRDLGCDVFQGYHFSKPLSADAFRVLASDPAWLARLKRVAPISLDLQGFKTA